MKQGDEKSGSGKISSKEKKQKKKKGNSRHRRIFVVAHSGWIEQLLIGLGRCCCRRRRRRRGKRCAGET